MIAEFQLQLVARFALASNGFFVAVCIDDVALLFRNNCSFAESTDGTIGTLINRIHEDNRCQITTSRCYVYKS